MKFHRIANLQSEEEQVWNKLNQNQKALIRERLKQSSKMTEKPSEGQQVANIYIKRNFNFDINNFIEVGGETSLER